MILNKVFHNVSTDCMHVSKMSLSGFLFNWYRYSEIN